MGHCPFIPSGQCPGGTTAGTMQTGPDWAPSSWWQLLPVGSVLASADIVQAQGQDAYLFPFQVNQGLPETVSRALYGKDGAASRDRTGEAAVQGADFSGPGSPDHIRQCLGKGVEIPVQREDVQDKPKKADRITDRYVLRQPRYRMLSGKEGQDRGLGQVHRASAIGAIASTARLRATQMMLRASPILSGSGSLACWSFSTSRA